MTMPFYAGRNEFERVMRRTDRAEHPNALPSTAYLSVVVTVMSLLLPHFGS